MTGKTAGARPYILIGSLLLNVLLVGILIGGALRGPVAPSEGPGRGERALIRGIERSVPDADREAVRNGLRTAFRETRLERRKLRQTRRALVAALGAEPYEVDAVEAAFAAMRTAEADVDAKLQAAITREFARLTPEQRRLALDEASRPRRRHRGSRERDDRPDRAREDGREDGRD